MAINALVGAFYPRHVTLTDKWGRSYNFEAFSLSWRGVGGPGVYAFALIGGEVCHLMYIGSSSDLSTRWSSHEKMSAAIARGANALLVLRRNALADPDYLEVEQSLIERYNPPLNVQHRTTGANALAGTTRPKGKGIF